MLIVLVRDSSSLSWYTWQCRKVRLVKLGWILYKLTLESGDQAIKDGEVTFLLSVSVKNRRCLLKWKSSPLAAVALAILTFVVQKLDKIVTMFVHKKNETTWNRAFMRRRFLVKIIFWKFLADSIYFNSKLQNLVFSIDPHREDHVCVGEVQPHLVQWLLGLKQKTTLNKIMCLSLVLV